LEKLEKGAAKVGLKVNEFKIKEIRVDPSTDLALTVNGREMKQVEPFIYLHSVVSIGGGALEDVWSHIQLFSTNVKSILSYSCET
jgi:hypothetical protein